MKKKVWVIGVLAVVGVASFFIVSQASSQKSDVPKEAKKEDKKETIYPVALTSVVPKEMRTVVSSTATLKADRQVDIFAKLAGQVDMEPLEEGQHVAQGQVLVSLDDLNTKLRVDQSKVMMDKARSEFERGARSYEKHLISAGEYDLKKFELEKSEADYKLASYELELTRITAPFQGTIVARHVEKGQTIQISEKLFTLAALSPLEAEVYLPESKVSNLSEGLVVELFRDVPESKPLAGLVTRISPIVDKETGTVKVTLAVRDVPAGVRPGTYVHLDIVTSSGMMNRVIPKKALVFDSRQNTFVFVSRPATDREGVFEVTRTAVETGVEDGDYVAINTGLEEGDLVVLTGKESLKDGALVKDINQPAESLAKN